MDRFYLSHVDMDGCWIWIRTMFRDGYGAMFRDGYGAMYCDGKMRRAHRVSYEIAHSITLEKENLIHHICRNKACVNPLHLECTTQYTHADSATYGNKEEKYCPHGHKYTPENTYWNRGGRSHECLQCKLIRSRRQYKRNKLAKAISRAEVVTRIKLLADKCGYVSLDT